MQKFIKVLCLSLLLLTFAVTAFAQTETGQISGTVTDSSGAVVPNAKVTAVAVATGTTRSASSSSAGLFTFPSLKPAVYKVIVEAKGFEKFEKVVQVAVSANVDVPAKLIVGSDQVVVEVSASAASVAVNTENQTIAEVVSSEQLQQLPTSPTRDPYALVGLSGNVVEDASAGTARGTGYSINGQRTSSTSVLLDGAENVDTFTSQVGQKVPLDSVQEFSVLTNNFGAEYGRAAGGVVNLVTKSGTNQFHGSLYEFNRVSALASNTYYNNANDTPKGTFARNNFGFSVGGPIKKNKLFFFDNLEWVRVRSSSPIAASIIDPASYSSLNASSQAFFTAYGKLDPSTKVKATSPCNVGTDDLGNPLAGSNLNCDLVSYTAPTDAGGGAPQNTWDHVAKVDWNISSKTTLTGRYAAYHELDFAGFVNASPYAGYNTGQTNYDQNYTVGLTHIFTPQLVNTTKVVYNRLTNIQPLGANPVGPTLYTALAVPNVPNQNAALQFPGYNQTTPGESIPFGGPQNLYQFYNDVSITAGKHQLKFGGQFIQIRDNRTYGAYENAVETLGTNLTSGLANLISGNLRQFQSAVDPQGKYPCVKDLNGNPQVTAACTLTLPVNKPAFDRHYHYNDSAIYAQDSWKVTRRLTVNAGLRWEYYGVQHNDNPALDSNFVLGTGSNIFEQIRNGQVKLAKDGGVFWKPNYDNFGPRVGFAWDPFGNGKTSVRGGYSIGYERNFGNVTFNAIQNPPAYAVVSLVAGSDVPSMPVYVDNNGPLAGTGSKALPAVSQRAINQNLKSAYAETWNLGVEQSISKNTLFSVSYAGSRGLHLYDIANINPTTGGGLYLGDSLNVNCKTDTKVAISCNRPNLQYSNMNYRSDNGYSKYNALIVGFKANNVKQTGLSFSADYTWAHSLDNLSSTFTEAAGGLASGNYQLGYIDAFNPKLNYGNSDFDVRHRLILSGTWEMPFAKNASNKVVRHTLGGWVIGGTLNVRSGAPFTLYDCSNSNDTGCPLWAGSAALQKSGSTLSSNDDGSFNYIALPTVGGKIASQGIALATPVCTGLDHVGCTYTTNGSAYPERNQFRGPGFWNSDMTFLKNIKISERIQTQFRAELYNIFNHSNQYISYNNLDVSSLTTPFVQTVKGATTGIPGQSTDENRRVQFGLRLTF